METYLLIKPKNLNLYNFPLSFSIAIKQFRGDKVVFLVNKESIISHLLQILIKLNLTTPSNQCHLFLFATQPGYVVLLIICRIWAALTRKDLIIYLQMHEPWYEPGRANTLTRLLLISLNFILSRLSHKIILPSEQSLAKAKLFVNKNKLFKINLTFPFEIDENKIKKDLDNLKLCWISTKTISLFGGTGADRNPEGFLRLASISQAIYKDDIRFIRAGVDKKITIDYKTNGIIDFVSYISEAAKDFLISLTHIVVVPYSFSTQSAVIPEALSQGKLLIVNDIPAFSYLRNKLFAFIINFNNETEIFECLNTIQSLDAEEYEYRCRLAIAYFQEHHSQKYLSKNISTLLEYSK